jgi:hypothetical protein
VWKPITEAAPDYEAPFVEQRQSAKRKGVPRKPKSKSKRKKKKDADSKKRSHGTCDDKETAAAAVAAACNDVLSKSAVVATLKEPTRLTMTVVPVVQSCRRSGRVRLGFPPNSFIVMRYRRDSKTQNPIDLMVGDKKNKLGEVVFNCWTRPSEGEEFTGYDVFKLNELEYPDYTKVKICDAYVKFDNEKGASQPKWTRHRAKMFAGFEDNVQDGKKVKVPTYVCVPVNPDTLEDVAGASDVTVPAYRLRLTAWEPITEAAPDYEAPFVEQRQSAKRKGVPRKSKSNRKKLRKEGVFSKAQSQGTCSGDEVAAAAAAAAAAADYNDMLSKSAVVTTETKRVEIPHIPLSDVDHHMNGLTAHDRAQTLPLASPSHMNVSATLSITNTNVVTVPGQMCSPSIALISGHYMSCQI